ncbi:MAG: hypothetical protein RLZZ141_31 [Pseudomonadota bacterium]|jgi:hypothetical protein
MKRFVTGSRVNRREALAPILLALGHEIVTGHQPAGLNDQHRWPNLRWMQKAIPQ